jgi:hypothetical protein
MRQNKVCRDLALTGPDIDYLRCSGIGALKRGAITRAVGACDCAYGRSGLDDIDRRERSKE